MSEITRAAICTLLSLALTVFAGPGQPQAPPESGKSKQNERQGRAAVDFLNTNQELRKHYSCRFTGEFRSIPDDLEAELESAFPKSRFLIAEMEVYTDPPVRKRDLVLVTDGTTGVVTGFIWFFGWTMPSASFQRLLLGEKVTSKQRTLSQLRTLAKLIVYTGSGRLGKAYVRKAKISVELIAREEVFRTLEVRIDRKCLLGFLTIRRQDGKKIM